MTEIIQFVSIAFLSVILLSLVVFIAIITTIVAFELGGSLAEYWNNKLRDYLRKKLNK